MKRLFHTLSVSVLVLVMSACADDGEVDVARDSYATENGESRCDRDGDRYVAASCGGDDCHDLDPSIYPGSGCDEYGNCLPRICVTPFDPDGGVP